MVIALVVVITLYFLLIAEDVTLLSAYLSNVPSRLVADIWIIVQLFDFLLCGKKRKAKMN